MSDGPHSSLPMRRGWRKVAEVGDNGAFAPAEVAAAIVPALHDDCRDELPADFIHDFPNIFHSLFQNQPETQLENLRAIAGNGLGQTAIDYAIQLAANGHPPENIATEALTRALNDHGARGVRSVEEHYQRESTEGRALHVRARLEEAIGLAQPAIEGLARSVLGIGPQASVRLRKQQDLDDGVTLP